MQLTIDLDDGALDALRRFAEDGEVVVTVEAAASMLLRDQLIAAGYLEVPEEDD